MKKSFFQKLVMALLVSLALFNATAFADESVKINLSEPPFFMSSYDEFNDLQSEQKDFYIEQLKKELIKFPKVSGISTQTWVDAPDWFKSWDVIRGRVYLSCQKYEMRAQCEKLSDLRIETLNLFANEKLENRSANKISAADSK